MPPPIMTAVPPLPPTTAPTMNAAPPTIIIAELRGLLEEERIAYGAIASVLACEPTADCVTPAGTISAGATARTVTARGVAMGETIGTELAIVATVRSVVSRTTV